MNLANRELIKILIWISIIQLCLFRYKVIADRSEGSSCPFANGDNGVCRRLTQCVPVVNQLMTRSISYSDLVHCSFIGREEVICCPEKATGNPAKLTSTTERISNAVQSTSSAPRTTGSRSNTNRTTLQIVQQACERYSQNASIPINFNILNGEPTLLGEFPHMAALGYEGDNGILWNCGGSLISERYVLTAAHCANRVEALPIVVRLGIIKLVDPDNEASPIDVNIERIVRHPLYKSKFNYYDIALIKLSEDINYQSMDSVRPACLYANKEDPSPNVVLVGTGWGTTETGYKSNVLLKVNLTSFEFNACNNSYAQSGLTRTLERSLIDSQLCAYDPQANIEKIGDTCNGDSGGPLQIINNRYISTIVGVTSFGKSCGTTLPSVYTRVASYLDWIQTTIWPS